MGYDLDNKKWRLHINNAAYFQLLRLARMYGWQPQGAKPPPRGTFSPDGNYFWNENQMVTDEDARAIAYALLKALDDIPDCDMPDNETEINWQAAPTEIDIPGAQAFLGWLRRKDSILRQKVGVEHVRRPNLLLHPNEFFGGQQKLIVMDFIAFCMQGGFTIS